MRAFLFPGIFHRIARIASFVGLALTATNAPANDLAALHADTHRGKAQQLTSPKQVPQGLAKSDWSDIRAAYEAERHAFQPVPGGWQARNPGQQWTTIFKGRDFIAEPRDGGWQWGLALQSYGFGEAQHAVGGTPTVQVAGQRLSYQWDGTVQEWFVNDSRGLEHGFTLALRPADESASPASHCLPLSLTLQTRGTLRPTISADAQGVVFQNSGGTAVLHYAGLKVWDADGAVLPSHFEAAGESGLRLLVDERGARYPLTIDPIAQQAYLKPAAVATTQAGDNFGASVAVSGNTVVVGAISENSSTTGVNSTPNELGLESGAAYVFVRSGGVWTQQAYLKPAAIGATQIFDNFGISVAISGDTVVVGADGEDSSTTGINSTPNESASAAGAAYIFVRSGTTWSQQAYLKPAAVGASQAGDQFGLSVAVSGDTVVVGAYAEDSNTTGVNSAPNQGASDSGAAYVFVRNGTVWSQQAYLKQAAFGTFLAGDNFGRSVAVSGDTLVVGAPAEDSSTTGVNSTPNESGFDSGAAYVFVRSAGIWTQQAFLKPSAVGTTQVDDRFGTSVAVSGDTVVVGAPREDSSTTGVNNTPNESADSSGAAYVFARSAGVWIQQAYLKPTAVGPTQAGDTFGVSVAIWGDTAVVGAAAEDSSTTGVNSTPNEGASASGATYVFGRSAGVWTQQTYLKPAAVGTTQAGDNFGTSVAVSADMVVVGAINEDSSSTGVNSTPNEGASASGATFIFTGLSNPEIAVQQPPGTDLSNGGAANFGTTRTGTEAILAFNILNSGTGDLTGVSAGITGADAGAFTLRSTPAGTIPGSGGISGFSVGFTPLTPGLKTATLQILSNDSDESPFTLRLEGVGITPEIVVHDGNAAAPELSDGQDAAVDFGIVRRGSPQARVFTVTNTGTAPLLISSVTVPPGFSVLDLPPLPATVAVAQKLTFGLQIDAAELGTFAGRVSLESDDLDEAVFDFPVTGTVVSPEIAVHDGNGAAPELSDSQAAAVDFGIVRQSFPQARVFTISNTGTAPLLVSKVIVPPGFSILDLSSLPATVAVAQTLTFGLQIDAAALGIFAGRVSLESDDLDEAVFDFPVTGTVVSPEIAVHDGNAAAPELSDGQAAPVNFGRIVQGTPATGRFTIANTGTAPLLISGIAVPTGYTPLNVPALPLTIPANQTAAFQVSLTTLTVGTHSGSVVIASDDLDEDFFDFPVTGEVFIPDPVAAAPAAAAALNRQTGLREQTIHITNDTTATVPAYNLIIRGLPAGVEVNNASDHRADGSWVVYVRRMMNPHTAQDILLEYFSPNRLPAEFTPQISTEVVLLPPDLSVPGDATTFRIDVVKALPGGGVLIEFPTTTGRRYQVQYSNAGTLWQSSLPSIRAAANRIQWVDRGLPRTDRPPASTTSRFYRVLEVSP